MNFDDLKKKHKNSIKAQTPEQYAVELSEQLQQEFDKQLPGLMSSVVKPKVAELADWLRLNNLDPEMHEKVKILNISRSHEVKLGNATESLLTLLFNLPKQEAADENYGTLLHKIPVVFVAPWRQRKLKIYAIDPKPGSGLEYKMWSEFSKDQITNKAIEESLAGLVDALIEKRSLS